MLLEHKLYEPAFYSTVISDWGSSILAAQQLGPKAQCLVDLGHHAPNVNIEQIVARLHRFGKLGGFHFNDSKYGDDDLDSGSDQSAPAVPGVQRAGRGRAQPARRLRPRLHDRPVAQRHRPDREHAVVAPRRSPRAYAKALLVDRDALHEAQDANDVMMAFQALRRAYRTDVTPILAMARDRGRRRDRRRSAAYRDSGWRERKAQERSAVGLGAGIV